MSRIPVTVDFDRPGASTGHLLLTYSDDAHAYSTITIPIAIVNGAPGPTVLLVAGTHGDEWEGQLIARRLASELGPEELRGRLILLPAHNLPAVRVSHRCSPIDGLNLNRVFPGDARGTPTAMIADYVETGLLPRCDYALDLHSGGSASEYAPGAFIRIDDDAKRTEAKVMAAEALGLPFSYVVDGREEDRTLSAGADRQDAVMVATELGGGGRVSRRVVEQAMEAVRRLLAFWGVTPAPTAAAAQGTTFIRLGGAGACRVATYGLLEPLSDLGAEVDSGQPIARVHPVEDLSAASEVVTSPIAGVVVAIRTPPLVRPGDLACSIGAPIGAAEVATVGTLA